eukprot:2934562-Pyramimonas_sp.AAC.1
MEEVKVKGSGRTLRHTCPTPCPDSHRSARLGWEFSSKAVLVSVMFHPCGRGTLDAELVK